MHFQFSLLSFPGSCRTQITGPVKPSALRSKGTVAAAETQITLLEHDSERPTLNAARPRRFSAVFLRSNMEGGALDERLAETQQSLSVALARVRA